MTGRSIRDRPAPVMRAFPYVCSHPMMLNAICSSEAGAIAMRHRCAGCID